MVRMKRGRKTGPKKIVGKIKVGKKKIGFYDCGGGDRVQKIQSALGQRIYALVCTLKNT